MPSLIVCWPSDFDATGKARPRKKCVCWMRCCTQACYWNSTDIMHNVVNRAVRACKHAQWLVTDTNTSCRPTTHGQAKRCKYALTSSLNLQCFHISMVHSWLSSPHLFPGRTTMSRMCITSFTMQASLVLHTTVSSDLKARTHFPVMIGSAAGSGQHQNASPAAARGRVPTGAG